VLANQSQTAEDSSSQEVHKFPQNKDLTTGDTAVKIPSDMPPKVPVDDRTNTANVICAG